MDKLRDVLVLCAIPVIAAGILAYVLLWFPYTKKCREMKREHQS